MSSDLAICAENLGKCYRIYASPQDRLKQLLWGRYLPQGYGHDFWALRHCSFNVHKGEMLGIIGRNGSGKSTLLQLLAGTLEPSEGSFKQHGRISALLELGSGFNPEFTGRENVFLAGAILGLDRQDMRRRLQGILDFADIGEFIDQPVKTYSSGMAVRLAFAVAASVEPEILIVDEALAVGDFVFQQRCFKRFQRIREGGTTVLFVSHDLSSIVRNCDRALVLARGSMVGLGSAKAMIDVYKQSLAEDVARILGNPTRSDEAISSCQAQEQQRASPLAVHFPRNPNAIEYGEGSAIIYDWGLLDQQDQPMVVLRADEPVQVVVRVRSEQTLLNPILTFTFKDLKGNEICGTNTWFAGQDIGHMEPGEAVEARFLCRVPIRSGAVTLSVSCTEMTTAGLLVHHRLYDVLLLEVIYARRFVGVFDPSTEVRLARLGAA